MPENPKRKSPDRNKVVERTETWADDQQNRGYYYDDAHGYEEFDPEADDDETDADEDQAAS